MHPVHPALNDARDLMTDATSITPQDGLTPHWTTRLGLSLGPRLPLMTGHIQRVQVFWSLNTHSANEPSPRHWITSWL